MIGGQDGIIFHNQVFLKKIIPVYSAKSFLSTEFSCV